MKCQPLCVRAAVSSCQLVTEVCGFAGELREQG